MKKQNLIRKTLICFFILSLIGFLTNCEKNEITNSDIYDFVNPLESVGEIHNKGLEYIRNNFDCSISTKELSGQLCKITEDFVTNNLGNELIYNPSVDYIDLGNAVLNCIDNNEIKSLSTVPFIEKDKAQDYYDLLISLISNNINSESSLLFKKVQKLEYEIYYSSLPETDRYLLLTICSIGKYSFQFWSEYIETVEYNKYSKASKGDLKEKLINSDIEGAIGGAIIGGIGGAIWGSVLLPGVGTITAAIVEAVHGGFYGAFIGSGIGLIGELIK